MHIYSSVFFAALYVYTPARITPSVIGTFMIYILFDTSARTSEMNVLSVCVKTCTALTISSGLAIILQRFPPTISFSKSLHFLSDFDECSLLLFANLLYTSSQLLVGDIIPYLVVFVNKKHPPIVVGVALSHRLFLCRTLHQKRGLRQHLHANVRPLLRIM